MMGEMRVGEVAAPVGLWTPIMSVPSVFHGDEGGYERDVGSIPGYRIAIGVALLRDELCEVCLSAAGWSGRRGGGQSSMCGPLWWGCGRSPFPSGCSRFRAGVVPWVASCGSGVPCVLFWRMDVFRLEKGV